MHPGPHLEEFLIETPAPRARGSTTSATCRTSWRGAVWAADLAQRFRDETVMTSPPPAVQRVVTPLLARFAR